MTRMARQARSEVYECRFREHLDHSRAGMFEGLEMKQEPDECASPGALGEGRTR